MRIHPPTAVLGIVAAGLFATSAIDQSSDAVGSDERCQVLRAYIDIIIRDGASFDGSKPVMVSHDTSILSNNSTVEEFLLDPRTPYSLKTSPLVPLYIEHERLATLAPVDVCPDLLNGLDGFEWLEEDHSLADQTGDDGYFPVEFFSLSIPAISQDGRQAILTSGMTYAPLAGGGWSVIMQKDGNGVWRVLDQDPTWIS